MKTIAELDNYKCFGCASCEDICPTGSIHMKLKDFFYFPFIDSSKCVKCGKCVDYCPSIQKPEGTQISDAIILVAKNKDIYEKSSSGGLFGVAAHYFLDNKNSIVVGASIDENCNVTHKCVDIVKDIEQLQGSKYVQSSMSGIYKEIQGYLKENRSVLFCGTPCQVAAVKKRFGDSNNLYLIDIVCHGVPSPQLLKEHINKAYCHGKKLEHLSFRTKDKYDRYGFNLRIRKEDKDILIAGNEDSYYRLFLREASFRESCYKCPYANNKRMGDITIGDCGNSMFYKDFNPNKTISTIYPITTKGKKLWEEIKTRFDFQVVDAEFEISANAQLNHPASRPDIRDEVYSSGIENLDGFVRNKLGKVSIKIKLKNRFKRIIPEQVRLEIIRMIKRRV